MFDSFFGKVVIIVIIFFVVLLVFTGLSILFQSAHNVEASSRLPNDYVFEGTIDRHSHVHSFTSSGGNHCVFVKDIRDVISISCTKGQ